MRMRLISLNVGLRIDNAEKVGDFIRGQQPDIVAFQELMRHFDDSVYSKYRSKKVIEDILKMPHSFFGPQWVANRIMKDGKVHHDFNGFVEQGNEILSRFPIAYARNEFYHKSYSLELDHTDFFTEDHPRCVEIVELDLGKRRLQVLNLHGLYSRDKKDSERTLAQCRFVIEAAKRKDIPTIIAGDFNLLPDTESIGLMNEEFRNLTTEYGIRSTVPDGRFAIDYIFVDRRIRVDRFEVLATDVSDHLPLVLDFGIEE